MGKGVAFTGAGGAGGGVVAVPARFSRAGFEGQCRRVSDEVFLVASARGLPRLGRDGCEQRDDSERVVSFLLMDRN
jgi:hypothetical protein